MNLTISNKAKTIHPLSAQLIPSRYSWLSLEFAEPNLGVPPNIILNENSATETWVLTSDYLGFRGWASYDPLNFPFFSAERPDLETIGDAVEELIYKNPNPLRFFLLHPTAPTTPRTNVAVELGDSFWCNTASLSWVSNKVNPLAIVSWYLDLTNNSASNITQWQSGGATFTSYPSRQGDAPFCLQFNTTQTIQYRLTAVDWSGKLGFASLDTFFRPAIYFGVTFNPARGPNGSNWPLSNNTGQGSVSFKRIQTSIFFDHFVNFNDYQGAHFYVCIPEGVTGITTNPTIYLGTFEAQGTFPVTGIVYTGVPLTSDFGLTQNYTVIVSQNPQNGQLRISYR